MEMVSLDPIFVMQALIGNDESGDESLSRRGAQDKKEEAEQQTRHTNYSLSDALLSLEKTNLCGHHNWTSE